MRLTRPAPANHAIPPGFSELIVFDDNLPGAGVRLRTGGKPVWVAQYRQCQKQRRVTRFHPRRRSTLTKPAEQPNPFWPIASSHCNSPEPCLWTQGRGGGRIQPGTKYSIEEREALTSWSEQLRATVSSDPSYSRRQ